jgi:hypothetical protein
MSIASLSRPLDANRDEGTGLTGPAISTLHELMALRGCRIVTDEALGELLGVEQ